MRRKRVLIASLTTATAGIALIVLICLFGGTAAAGSPSISTPEEWKTKGYESFASDMSTLYQQHDDDNEYHDTIRISQDFGVVVDGSHISASDGSAEASENGVLLDAKELLSSLGYSISVEADGFRAVSEKRGDEVYVHGGCIEVNGSQTGIEVSEGEGGNSLVEASQVCEEIGYEVLRSTSGEVVIQDPWQTARVVARGVSGIDDPSAQSIVNGPGDMVVLQYETVREAREAAGHLRNEGMAYWTGPDRVVGLCDDENDPLNWEPEGALSWGNSSIGSDEMQRSLVRKYGSVDSISQVVVAVVDTGLDMDHELFDGRLVSGYDFVDDDDDPEATSTHGTHVSGIVANNTPKNVKIMPLRSGEDKYLTETAIYSAIEYAISHGADVINMSFGSEWNTQTEWAEESLEQSAIRDAELAGIVMVAGHGNDEIESSLFFPSSDQAVISVSAVNEDGTLCYFSNYGAPVDLCGPGFNIYSATLGGTYEYASGTSIAAPFVSAASALALSDDSGRSAAAVRELLQNNARDLGDKGWDKFFGYGCVDVSNLTDAHFSATIGSRGFESFRAAYDAASDGDTIVLLQDVELDSTFEVDKSVAIRSDRSQGISLSQGAESPALRVTKDVTLGESGEAGREFSISMPDGCEVQNLVEVTEEGSLTIRKSASLNADCEGSVVSAEGTLTIDGAKVRNSAAGLCVYGTAPVLLDGCVIENGDDEAPSVACSSVLGIAGRTSVNGVRLHGGGYIEAWDTIPNELPQIAITINDAAEGRTAISWSVGHRPSALPFYLTDLGWKLVESGNACVLARAASFDARIGDATYESLATAIKEAKDGDVVTVCRDVMVSDTLEFSRSVSIASEGNNELMASPSLEGPLLCVGVDAEVAVACEGESSLSFDGLRRARMAPLISIGDEGRLALGGGVFVTGFSSTCEDASPLRNQGTLIIGGAVVTGNSAMLGGGVYNAGSMELRSGSVSSNEAVHAGGGIYNTGTLSVYGGSVDENRTIDQMGAADGAVGSGLEAQGGGVWNSGTLTIAGGSISRNGSDSGGGVYNAGTLLMSDGTVSQNVSHAVYEGYCELGKCKIYSGEGGGIYSIGTFDMSGGEVRENNALSRGGGISVPRGTFTLTGGEIVDNSTDGGSYYAGAGEATFFKAGGIFSFGGIVRLFGGIVKSTEPMAGNNVLISSYAGTEVGGTFRLEGGMLWASSLDNPTVSVNGLPIRVVSELLADEAIEVFSVNYSPDTVIATYAEGLQPDLTDFALGDFGPNPYTNSGGDTLRVDGQSLVLTRQVVEASEGWERNGSCEQRLDEDGTFTVRPINGVEGMLAKKLELPNRDAIVKVVIEDSVIVNNSSYFFAGCGNLEEADVSGLAGVVNAESMFFGCRSLREVRLPKLRELKCAEAMFYGCESLRSVDTAVFEGARLVSSYSMFMDCSSLESLDMSNVDMSHVTNVSSMFFNCSSLGLLDVSNWDVGSVTKACNMFSYCSMLSELDVSRWNTMHLEDMSGMFINCSSLRSLDLSSWNTSKLSKATHAFIDCASMESIDLSGWDTSSVTEMGGVFFGCSSLVEFKVGSRYKILTDDMFPDATADSGWWSSADKCWYSKDEITSSRSGVADVYLNYDPQVISGTWGTCPWEIDAGGRLTVGAGRGADTGGASPWGEDACARITSAAFDAGVELPADCSFLFANFCSLTSLDLSTWDTSSVVSMDYMFCHCTSLATLDLSGWDTSSVKYADRMFDGCESLSELTVGSGYQIKSAEMFPDATAGSGWWSSADGRWYSKGEIVSSRSGVADTYLSHEPEGPDLSLDGWVDLPGGAKGYARGGSLVAGWMDLDGAKYWFGDDGRMATGWTDVEVDGRVMHYYFNPASGNLARGTWMDVDGQKYYFRESGNMATGWTDVNGSKYYLDESGHMLVGWQEIDGRRVYLRPSGTMATGFETVGGATYLFRESGSLVTGWGEWDGRKYWAEDDGTLARDCWRDVDTGNGYFGHYYFRPSGSMATGWATIDGRSYWFRESGNMATGFSDVDDAYKRYFDESGQMLVGWQEIGGNTYYFRPSGAMQTGTATIDGVTYVFNDSGTLRSVVVAGQSDGDMLLSAQGALGSIGLGPGDVEVVVGV